MGLAKVIVLLDPRWQQLRNGFCLDQQFRFMP